VKYWYGYFFLKNLEWGFRRVMCLSGCLTAYRRSVLIELEPLLAERSVLGVPIKYGEDRFLTRQIIKAGYLTTMTLDARCRTFVPTTIGAYFSQQLRWRRSNIVDYVGGVSHVWRLNPIIAIHFFSLFALLLVYPLAIIRSLMAFKFFPMMTIHLAIVFMFGVVYVYKTRRYPKEEKVGAFDFAPITFLMPITYALLTPLALFTLDTANWETRGHEDANLEPVPEPARDGVSSEIVVGEPAHASAVIAGAGGRVTGRRRESSHAQLPAA
jgi:cellulose synthase/poly-beta-1,6-N-acetylglucosamine synthase-like glycosyltransferase